MQEWLFTTALSIIGLFLISNTYIALYQSKKRNKFISGVPFFGGFILAVAFLFSPIKWLAFLGFIDYGLWFLPYSLIYDHFQNRRFQKVYMQQDFVQRVRDNTKSLSIKILERNEDLLNPFVTNLVYNLAVPKLLFAICTDKDGKNYLLVDKYEKNRNIAIYPFIDNTIQLTGLKLKECDLTVKFEIIEKP